MVIGLKIFGNISAFEKYFSLLTTNKQFADSIITENVKEALVQLYEEYEIPFEISVKDNFIYIRGLIEISNICKNIFFESFITIM